jgi:hypothetical protein
MKKTYLLVIASAIFLTQTLAQASSGFLCQGESPGGQATLRHLAIKLGYKKHPESQKWESSPEFIFYGLKDFRSELDEVIRFKNHCGEKPIGVGARVNEWMEVPESLYCGSGDHILNQFSKNYSQINQGDSFTAVGTFYNESVFNLNCVFKNNIEKTIQQLGPYIDQDELSDTGRLNGIVSHGDSATNIMMQKVFSSCQENNKALVYLIKFSQLIKTLDAEPINISSDGYTGLGKRYTKKNPNGTVQKYKITEERIESADGTSSTHRIHMIIDPFNIAVYAQLDKEDSQCSVWNIKMQ